MNYFCSSGHERRFSIFLECNSKDAVAGKLCKSMSPLVWTSVSRAGAVGCTADFAGAKLTIAVSPSLPSFLFYFFFLPSLCAFLPLLFCFHHFLYLLVSCSPLPLPPFPCSMRHQVGSATLGCRAALRVTSATACLRARGPGISLQTSMKPCIVWTGFSMVSLQHTSMEALEGFAGCDA